MKNLIGKKFRYKSKYGGLSDWIGEIDFTVDDLYYYTKGGVYHIFGGIVKDDSYLGYLSNSRLRIFELSGNCYYLDEIEIID